MKLTAIQKTMLVFLTNPKKYTSWDFRKGVEYRKREVFSFKYDYLPRAIHNLEKIKLPSGDNIQFDRIRCTSQDGGKYIKYYFDMLELSEEDFIFITNIKNIKAIKVLKSK